jgi:hypothetical protein
LSTRGFSESADRRVLGGFVLIDAITGLSVLDPLAVTSTTLRLGVNGAGVYAIFDAPGYTANTNQFSPVPVQWPPPAVAGFEVTVKDSSLRYLPRRARVQAPQGLTDVFTPQQISLYASPSAVLDPNWAVVRASVTGTADTGLPWAIVRAIRSDNSVAATAMADARDEAVLAVMGLPLQVITAQSGPPTEQTTAMTIQAWFDPSVLQQPANWIPDPDAMLGNLSSLKTETQTASLGPGLVVNVPITIAI